MDEKAVQALRKEISDLLAADKAHRVRGSIVGWDDRKQHEARLTRIQEIKEQLDKLARGLK